jgi:hypothetical protein
MIKEDLQSTGTQINFVQKLIMPLLQSEQKIRVALNFVKPDGTLQPVTVGEGSGSKIDSSMFPTNILTPKMKEVLDLKF